MARKGNRWSSEVHTSARLPAMDIPAAKQHAKHWRALPAHHKVLHAYAHAQGLTVSHTDSEPFPHPEGIKEQGFLWIGDEATFRASALLGTSVNYSLPWARSYTGEGVEVSIAHGERGIYALHTGHGAYGPRSVLRLVTMADHDEAYQRARATMLRPVEGLELPADLYDWRGPIRIEVPQFAASNYAGRWGQFPKVAAAVPAGGELLVTLSLGAALAKHAADRVQWHVMRNELDTARLWDRYMRELALAVLKGESHGR